MKNMTRHARPLNKSLATFALLIMLGGCAVGPDFKTPEFETPEGYRTDVLQQTEIGELAWWQLFDDPALTKLVNSALENNRDVKIAMSRIAQARATLGFSRADQFPRLDITGNYQTGNYFGGSRSDDTITGWSATAPLTWELDFWGKYRRSTEAARAELLASEYGLRALQLTLVSDIVTTYNQLLDFKRRLAISRQTLETRIESLEIIQHRFDRGIIAEIDLNQAQIQKEIAAAAIPFYQRAVTRTENSLSILAGRLPGEIAATDRLEQPGPPPQIPVGIPSDILDRRPDIAQSLALLKAQTERIGVAQALRFPAISLTGSFGYASTELAGITTDGDVWSIGGQLLGPILDFGKNKRRVEIEEEKTRQLLYSYERTLLNAFREVEDALTAIATYKEELAAIDRQRAAALNANMLSKERYDKGVSSYLEVLETERSLFTVALQYSELQQLYYNSYVSVYKALGGGWITEQDRKSAQENSQREAGQQ